MATDLTPSAPPVFIDRDLDSDLFLHIPSDAHTLAGFRRWVLSDEFPEKQPVMFLKGEIYLFMPKEDLFKHAAVKTAVATVLGSLFRELDMGDFFINGVLVTNVDAEVSNNPDMVGILWASLESGKVRYNANKKHDDMEIEGSPDLLLEIVSTGSVKKDKQLLRQAYHKAGVREYWIIDARGEEIDFQVLHWRKSGYVAAADQAGWKRSRIFGRSFHLTRSRDRRGHWRYELALQPENS
jgi:Uma2 family endonuclease